MECNLFESYLSRTVGDSNYSKKHNTIASPNTQKTQTKHRKHKQTTESNTSTKIEKSVPAPQKKPIQKNESSRKTNSSYVFYIK